MPIIRQKPKLGAILHLRCPYCGQTPLQAEGAWFSFRRGCQACDFRFERELGYFTGASWMVAFPSIALLALGLCALIKGLLFPSVNTLLMIAGVSIFIFVVAAALAPYFMAIWLYADHCLHPISPDDSFDKELLN